MPDRMLPNLCVIASVIAVALSALNASACGRQAPPVAEAEEPEALSVTRWTDKTELFAEYPPLVAGQASRFAIHLTRLDTFKALTAGRVEVQLRGSGGSGGSSGSSGSRGSDSGGSRGAPDAPETFTVDAPSRPGIFGVDVTPARAGVRELVIVLRSGDLADEHRVGQVTVHANAEAARAGAADGGGEESPGISFLKEQQWSLDFATALVQEQAVRDSVRVPASIEARAGGVAGVAAPIDGRVTRVLDAPVGSPVSRGQELARLLPLPPSPGDLPQLQRARAEAASAHALAARDRERAERLTAAGAAPQKRLDEARASEQQAKARLDAADASLAQYDAARTGGVTASRITTGAGAPADASAGATAAGATAAGTAAGRAPIDAAGLFLVRAPIAGVIAQRAATTGANVTAGTPLFTIVDASHATVVGRVPESDAVRARRARHAEIEVAGEDARVPAGKLVGVGKVLDAATRTLPMTFAFDNRGPALPIGQSLFLHLLLDETAARPAVPAGAVVDDAGRPIVFVQRDGETFERRAVTLGPRAGDLVQVIDGLTPGERVVTKGAYLVRLASLTTTVPAHGHVH